MLLLVIIHAVKMICVLDSPRTASVTLTALCSVTAVQT